MSEAFSATEPGFDYDTRPEFDDSFDSSTFDDWADDVITGAGDFEYHYGEYFSDGDFDSSSDFDYGDSFGPLGLGMAAVGALEKNPTVERRSLLKALGLFGGATVASSIPTGAEAADNMPAYHRARTEALKMSHTPVLQTKTELIAALQKDFGLTLQTFVTTFNQTFPNRGAQGGVAKTELLKHDLTTFDSDPRAQHNMRLAVLIWYAYQAKTPTEPRSERATEGKESAAVYKIASELVAQTKNEHGIYDITVFDSKFGEIIEVGKLNTKSDYEVIEEHAVVDVLRILGFTSAESFANAFNSLFNHRTAEHIELLRADAQNTDNALQNGMPIDRHTEAGRAFRNLRQAVLIWIAKVRLDEEHQDAVTLSNVSFKKSDVLKALPTLKDNHRLAAVLLHQETGSFLSDILALAGKNLKAPNLKDPNPKEVLKFFDAINSEKDFLWYLKGDRGHGRTLRRAFDQSPVFSGVKKTVDFVDSIDAQAYYVDNIADTDNLYKKLTPPQRVFIERIIQLRNTDTDIYTKLERYFPEIGP